MGRYPFFPFSMLSAVRKRLKIKGPPFSSRCPLFCCSLSPSEIFCPIPPAPPLPPHSKSDRVPLLPLALRISPFPPATPLATIFSSRSSLKLGPPLNGTVRSPKLIFFLPAHHGHASFLSQHQSLNFFPKYALVILQAEHRMIGLLLTFGDECLIL